jgi:hypothetical protein
VEAEAEGAQLMWMLGNWVKTPPNLHAGLFLALFLGRIKIINERVYFSLGAQLV